MLLIESVVADIVAYIVANDICSLPYMLTIGVGRCHTLGGLVQGGKVCKIKVKNKKIINKIHSGHVKRLINIL